MVTPQLDEVKGSLYFADLGNVNEAEKPFVIHGYVPPHGIPAFNYGCEVVDDIKIRNLRTSDINYNRNGFTFFDLKSSMKYEDFNDSDKITKTYLPEIGNRILDATGGRKVVVFEWMIRRRDKLFPYVEESEKHQPVQTVHIGIPISILSTPAANVSPDYTPEDIADRMNTLFGDEAAILSQGKYEVVK